MDYARVAKTIGKRGTIEMGGLLVEVEVINYKQAYGKDRWEVNPIAGSGKIWVENVRIAKE